MENQFILASCCSCSLAVSQPKFLKCSHVLCPSCLDDVGENCPQCLKASTTSHENCNDSGYGEKEPVKPLEFQEGVCQICMKFKDVVECVHCNLDICEECFVVHKSELEDYLKHHLAKNATMINSRIKIIENIRNHSQNLQQTKAKLQDAVDNEATRLITKIQENQAECVDIIDDHFSLLISKDSSSLQIFDYELTKLCHENEEIESVIKSSEESDNLMTYMRTSYPKSATQPRANIKFSPGELKPIAESLFFVFPSTKKIFLEHEIKMSTPCLGAESQEIKSIYDVIEKEKELMRRNVRSRSFGGSDFVLPRPRAVERNSLMSESDMDKKIHSIVHDMHADILDDEEEKPRISRSRSFSDSKKLIQRLRKTFSKLGIDK